MTECVVCENNKNFERKFKILFECCDCGHIFADIDIDFEDVTEIYSDKYFFGNEYIDYISDKAPIEKNALVRNKIIKKYTKNFTNKNLYEIGCAYGFFLNKIKKNYDITKGIDVNENAIIYAKEYLNLNLEHGDFLSKKIKKDFYNIFCMFDVIEHLSKPNHFIKKINQISKKNTYLFITTGDIKSLNAKIKGKNWRLIHPPSHIHYFSRDSIKKLLEQNNFSIVDIKYLGNYRNIKFIINKIPFLKKNFIWLKKIFKFFNLDKKDIYLNLFDIMFVVAKKNEK